MMSTIKHGQYVLARSISSIAVLAVAASAIAATVDANVFRHKCVVTFSGYAGSETLLNFPALVRIPSGSPIYAATKADGSDIRFADSGGSLVPHEIDTWNPSGESLIWVKVPSLSGTGTTVTLYCGGMLLPAVDSREVWADAEYKGVWHFSGSNADSSTNALAATDSATAPTYNTTGKLGSAFFSSGTSYFEVANDGKWAGYDGNSLTVSAWVKTDATTGWGRIVCCCQNSQTSPGFELQMQNDSTRYTAAVGSGSSRIEHILYTQLNSNREYVYITAVYKNGTTELFANGTSVSVVDISKNAGRANPTNTVPVGTATSGLRVGASVSNNNYWNGSLDEVRLQWAAQSADWVKADFDTQNSSEFAVLGTLEENASLKINWKEFTYRCPVTFSGYTGSSVLENFPALVRIPSAIASKCRNNGADIRFVDSEGFIVPHEIDTWNPSGESLVWVSVPNLSGTGTTLTMYYRGRPSQSAFPRHVWAAADYRGVWHFSGSNADSSLNNLAVTTAGSPTFTDSGVVGKAYGNTVDNSCVEVLNDSSWAGYDGRALTLSAWIKTSVAPSFGRVISCKPGNSNVDDGFELTMQQYANRVNAIGNLKSTDPARLNQNVQELDNSFDENYVYVTAVFSNGVSRIYSNGSFEGEATWDNGILVPATRVLHIGRAVNFNNTWMGNLDEVRLQWAVQSPDWVAADYATQNNSNFTVLGQSEPLKGFCIGFR